MIGVIGDYKSNLFRGVVGDEMLPSYEGMIIWVFSCTTIMSRILQLGDEILYTQLYGDYNKPLKRSLLSKKYNGKEGVCWGSLVDVFSQLHIYNPAVSFWLFANQFFVPSMLWTIGGETSKMFVCLTKWFPRWRTYYCSNWWWKTTN